VILSLLFGTARGIVWEALRNRRNRRSLLAEARPAISQRGGPR
jgi:hypothetical protein